MFEITAGMKFTAFHSVGTTVGDIYLSNIVIDKRQDKLSNEISRYREARLNATR